MADIAIANTSAAMSGKTVLLADTDATVTALHSFSRSTSAPFAVNSGAGNVANLDADKLDGQEGSYYTNAANLTGTIAAVSGANVTNLNASNLASGTVPDARLSATVGNVDTTETVSGVWTFSAHPVFPSGSFTPALKFGGGSTGMTGTFEGQYVRTGQMVDVRIRITLTAKGSSSGAATITGLPFTSSSSVFDGLSVHYVANLGTSVACIMPYIGSGSTTVNLTYIPAAGATSTTNMTEATFANTTDIILTGSYSV